MLSTLIKLILLICLFLGTTMTRECREVHFKIGLTKISKKPERMMPTWVEQKRWHKHPSGPNPSGNRHPPLQP
ncbi:CLAVATA3/ESR (CLE)-related protein 46 [Cardamine amara subsp. amara]|uniref:CLAVATA3/ESR (CLE)-related protein 46 n=1 Tax=Cardamine amara subsp. amara TaxID=228776 RepID=A0ABD1B990_CARAN